MELRPSGIVANPNLHKEAFSAPPKQLHVSLGELQETEPGPPRTVWIHYCQKRCQPVTVVFSFHLLILKPAAGLWSCPQHPQCRGRLPEYTCE